ncbi:MAG: hypothetical protein JKY93_06750 [Gammaproteobacteria bacterium]|nr:hypothetical protein [Gammaproteobacteria bacterium]
MDKNKTKQSRHLAALFTFFSLLPLVYYIPPWLTSHVSDDPRIVTLLAVAIIVPIVSYIALPLLFKLTRLRK